MKKQILIAFLMMLLFSCSKENNDPQNTDNIIRTSGFNFVPNLVNCNVGDTIFFDLGGTHNAVEVSEESYNSNSSTPLENGFIFDFGSSGYIVANELKTYYYVCTPHLPNMKARIVVN